MTFLWTPGVKGLTLKGSTPQNGQTHSNNSLATVYTITEPLLVAGMTWFQKVQAPQKLNNLLSYELSIERKKAKIANRNQRNQYNFNIPEVFCFITTNKDRVKIKLTKK